MTPHRRLPPTAPCTNPGAYDLEEYAPGTILPSPSKGNPVTQGVHVSPVQQMQSWPAPRYHAPPLAQGGGEPPMPELQVLSVSWISDYLAGGNQPPQPWTNGTGHITVVTAIEETAHLCIYLFPPHTHAHAYCMHQHCTFTRTRRPPLPTSPAATAYELGAPTTHQTA